MDQFFDKEEIAKDEIKTGIIVLTQHQEKLVSRLLDALHKYAPDRIERIENRMRDVNNLANAIAQFPSLLERTNMTSSVRTPQELIDSLISYQEDGDTTLHMPSKAILGKGFLVAKIHTFYSMSKLAKNYAHMTDAEVKEYSDETISMMFTLMAEDVYLNLIKDKTLSLDLAQACTFAHHSLGAPQRPDYCRHCARPAVRLVGTTHARTGIRHDDGHERTASGKHTDG